VGLVPTPVWLDTAGLHGYLLGRRAGSAADAHRAAARYATLVAEGRDARLWDSALRQQIYLGDGALRPTKSIGVTKSTKSTGVRSCLLPIHAYWP
jgi:hypothetical protein